MGLGSFLGFDDRGRRRMMDEGRDFASRRNKMSNRLEQQLMAQARGEGPSIAQEQLEQGMAQAMAQQQSLSAGARPGMGGLAQRMAAQNTGRIQGQMADSAALLRLQEQLAAQQALASQLTQNRQLDLGQYEQAAAMPTFGSALVGTAGQLSGFLGSNYLGPKLKSMAGGGYSGPPGMYPYGR